MTLRKFACGKSKRVPRGATSRIAKHLGISNDKTTRLIFGAVKPDAVLAVKIQNMIHARIDLDALKTGPKTKNGELSSLHTADTNQRLAKNRSFFAK